ncbi:MAG: aldo/keto reductase [Spirochaetales bacterium]|nr:aldo/keto reductase [Spirochaetales bacterium]
MELYLGTWQISPSDGFWTDQNRGESEKTVSFAIKNGISGYDCAQSYGHGQAEQTLGKILRRHPEASFKVDTKIMPTAKDPEELAVQSARRLGHAIDCLYLHWPRTGFDNRGFLERMATLKDRGLVRKVGVCNLPLKDLEAFVSDGLVMDRVQRPYSLLWPAGFDQELEFCRSHGIEMAVYSPTGMGLLSGRYRGPEDLNDARKDLFCFDPICRSQYLDLLELVSSLARSKGVSNTKVALSWAKLKKPDIVLIGARSTTQLQENLSADVRFTETEVRDLDLAARRLSDKADGICTNIFSYNW